MRVATLITNELHFVYRHRPAPRKAMTAGTLEYTPRPSWRGFSNVRYWPKADTRGRILDPKFGYPAFFGLLSVR